MLAELGVSMPIAMVPVLSMRAASLFAPTAIESADVVFAADGAALLLLLGVVLSGVLPFFAQPLPSEITAATAQSVLRLSIGIPPRVRSPGRNARGSLYWQEKP